MCALAAHLQRLQQRRPVASVCVPVCGVGNYEMLLMKEGNQVFNQMLLIDIDLSIVCTSFKNGTIKS